MIHIDVTYVCTTLNFNIHVCFIHHKMMFALQRSKQSTSLCSYFSHFHTAFAANVKVLGDLKFEVGGITYQKLKKSGSSF